VGIGDFGDLEALAEVLRLCGATVLQVLPLNDLGNGDAPYGAISAFALDPIYVALDKLEWMWDDKGFMARLEDARCALEALERVDYPLVRQVKSQLLREAFEKAPEDVRLAYRKFAGENEWLIGYAGFKVCKRSHLRPLEWSRDGIVREASKHTKEMDFEFFTQYCLDSQLRYAHERLNAMGIKFVGDVPILVSRDSVDVLEHPEIFRLDLSAGAPPDMYAQDGQNWGFPIYDFEACKASSFAWWRQRLQIAERFYDLFRIDHVVGLFRFWAIPKDEKTGRNGMFVPQEEWRWGEQGREWLETFLSATKMLPIAEDLGTIPPVCRQVLSELGICGLKVQRWERFWEGDRSFIPPSEYPPVSVATLSTHDSETFRGYYEAQGDYRRDLWLAMGKKSPPPEKATPEVVQEVIKWLSDGASCFMVLMIQDVLDALGLLEGDPASHRINVPAVISKMNWSWRMPVPVEDLVSRYHRDLGSIKELVGTRAG